MNAKTKKLLVGLLCLVMLFGLVPVTAYAAITVNSVAITNLAVPKAGATPTTSPSVATTGVKIYGVDWYDSTAGRFLENGDTFIIGHVYKVQVWAEAKSGYEFRYVNSATPNVTATVDGKSASVSKAYEYNAWAMVVVSYTFPACTEHVIQSLNIQLPGIAKVGNVLHAVENNLIPYEIESTSESISVYPELNINRYYPNGFRWTSSANNTVHSSGDRFKGGRDYYVHIAIQPDYGKFANNMSVTVNGKQATLKAKGADYAEVFVEVVCYGTISGTDIRPVVILPKAGNAPDMGATYVYPQCKNIDYAAVSGWYDVETGRRLTSDDKFVGGKQYRVEIYCMAAYPYQFDRDASDKMKYSPQITGVDVDSYSFGYDDYRGRELIYISKTFTAIIPDHTCVEGTWQCDADGHKRYCTVCKKALAGGAHWGGTATCVSGKLCEVCGYEYTKPNENHTPDTTKWTACGNLYHAHLCKVCGAHCDAQDHTPGPAATETTPQKCTVCNYVITPAKNHKHTIKEIKAEAPTCTQTGNSKYYMCADCAQLFTDKDGKKPLTDSFLLPALGHTAVKTWDHDREYHWHICATCKEVLPETKMSHDMKNGKCATCGYDTITPVNTTTVPTNSTTAADGSIGTTVNTDPGNETVGSDALETVGTTPTNEQDEQNGQQERGSVLWIVLGVFSVLAAGTVVAFFVIKKKKGYTKQ